ncbi:tRNA:m(4)X modification enzyme TRM, partial [Ananas comosus]
MAAAERCRFWLPNKRRYCANSPLPSSQFCGNHHSSSSALRVPCPIDPSHSVLQENLDSHVKRCPLRKQAEALEAQPYYSESINAGDPDEIIVSSAAKRSAIYNLSVLEFYDLVDKIRSVHSAAATALQDSYVVPEACEAWLKGQIDRRLPYQEKHVVQQASILGNMEAFGLIGKKIEVVRENANENSEGSDLLNGEEGAVPAVVEFGAGRGYLAQMLADCYGVKKLFLVERRSYKLKADRSLRQNQSLVLERLRIDIEDLNLHAVESLKGLPYLATGKHLCGPATDLTVRCCLRKQYNLRNEFPNNCYLQGLALATCCHHLCQWKHYTNTKFLSNMGITKEEFHAMTWFSSWAVDGDHSCELPDVEEAEKHLAVSIPAGERAALGFLCKEIIDTGRLLWLREQGLDARLVNYVPSNISPENHLLIAKH